jgi:PAS domain S-box-containing protein
VPIDLSIPLGARSEYARLVSQDRYRALFNSDVIGMSIAHYDGTIVEVNDALARLVGYTREELCTLGWRQITPEDQLGTDEHAIRSLEAYGYAPTWEKEVLHKDGTRIPILIGCTRLPDGEVITYILDNRARKRTEAALSEVNSALQERIAQSNNELRSLAAHLQSVREEQSATLAREIHDVLGQELTGLRLDAAWIARRLDDGQGAERDRLAEMQTRIDGLISTVREIARELRPKVLDDLGLCPALDALARDWSVRSGVAIELSLPESIPIDRDRATAMFRIFQELLTNTTRHAGAKRVRARLFHDAVEQHVGLDFDDDGCGMTPDAISGSLGLLGIRERLVFYNGEIAISSSPGRGTHVAIRLPLGVPGCAS